MNEQHREKKLSRQAPAAQPDKPEHGWFIEGFEFKRFADTAFGCLTLLAIIALINIVIWLLYRLQV